MNVCLYICQNTHNEHILWTHSRQVPVIDCRYVISSFLCKDILKGNKISLTFIFSVFPQRVDVSKLVYVTDIYIYIFHQLQLAALMQTNKKSQDGVGVGEERKNSL